LLSPIESEQSQLDDDAEPRLRRRGRGRRSVRRRLAALLQAGQRRSPENGRREGAREGVTMEQALAQGPGVGSANFLAWFGGR